MRRWRWCLPLAVVLALAVRAEIVRFRAATVRYKMSAPRRVTLEGGAEVWSASNIIAADRIEIAGGNLDEAVGTGRVTIRDLKTGTVFRAGRVEYFQRDEYIRLLQDPVMTAKDVVVRSGSLERHNDLRLSFLQGPTVVETTNVRVFCLQGRYEEERRMARLRGGVSVERGAGRSDRLRAEELILFPDSDRLILGRNVTGTLHFDD